MAENMILAGVFYFDHLQTDPHYNEENNVEILSRVVQSTPIIANKSEYVQVQKSITDIAIMFYIN
jgi:hypothetical protein